MKNLFRQFYEVYLREFLLVKHDGGLILFFLFLPFVYPILYSLIYNPELVRDVPMVIVDEDRSATSRELVRRLDATQQSWVIGYAADLPEARRAMSEKKAFAILQIPEGFERKIGRDEQAEAVMYCDMTLLLRYRGFLIASTNVMQDMGADITMERINEVAPLAGTISTGDPMPIDDIAMGNIESGFDSFIMPAVVILILHQAIILAIGMAGGAKRERPELIGYNPVNESRSPLITMLGQMACYLTILIVPVMFLMHYVPLIFSFPMAGDTLQEFAFILPMILACCGVGFMFQGIVRERESVFILWVVTSVVFLFLSGITWPRYAMSGIWKTLSAIIPATWGVEGFVKMNTNGATISQVSGCYIALWVQAAVYLTLGYCVQRWVVRRQIKRSIEERADYLRARGTSAEV